MGCFHCERAKALAPHLSEQDLLNLSRAELDTTPLVLRPDRPIVSTTPHPNFIEAQRLRQFNNFESVPRSQQHPGRHRRFFTATQAVLRARCVSDRKRSTSRGAFFHACKLLF